MPKLILPLGIQGSGKTYWSKKWAEEDPENRIRLNYDDIRNMLGKYWVPNRENVVEHIFNEGLNYSMSEGKDIVIDNFSNLNPKHQKEYKELVDSFNSSNKVQYEIEYKLFDTPLEVCLERDAQRKNPIGEKVIKQCWKQYRNYIISESVKKELANKIQFNPALPHCFIVDMDATLCFNTTGRPFYGEGAAEGMANDIPNDPIIDLVWSYRNNMPDMTYIVLTGRDTSCREATLKWLVDYDIIPDKLIMRPEGNCTVGDEMKKQLYKEHIEGKYNVDFVIDDSTKCVKMWRELGLTCLQPNEGKF